MIELSGNIKKSADERVKEIISGLQLATRTNINGSNGHIEIGYVFENQPETAEEDGLLTARVVGRSSKVLVLYLGEYEGNHLCARLPFSKGYSTASLIHHEMPPTKIEEHIEPLEDLLKDFDFSIPFVEDRHFFNAHPDFTPDKVYALIKDARDKAAAELRDGRPVPLLKEPELNSALHYTLAADLTENGKYTLHQMGELYTTTFGEDMINNSDYVAFGKYQIARYHKSVSDLAKRLKGGLDRIRELTALNHRMCTAIDESLIREDYEIGYADLTSHGIIFHSVKSMFSMRICDETGESDLVLHDPRNVLLKPAH